MSTLAETIQRIMDALNRRFEKDAEFYISKQDTQEIKDLLWESNFTTLVAWHKHKKHSPEILTKVILKNAWLIRPTPQKALEVLIPIFEQCQSTFFLEITDEVFEHKIDVPIDLQRILECLYYKKVSVDNCEQLLEHGHKNIEVLKICFDRIIQSILSPDALYHKVNQYFDIRPELKEITSTLIIEQLDTDQQEELANLIFDNEINPYNDPDYVWTRIFNRFGVTAFDIVIKELVGTYDTDQKKIFNKIIAHIVQFHKESQKDFAQKLISLYTDNPNIRLTLIFTVQKIFRYKNIELAKEIIEKFEVIDSDFLNNNAIGLLNESYHIFLDSDRGLCVADTRCYAEKMMIKTPVLVWRNVYERS